MEPGLITIYGTSWCPDCRRVKTFLKERGFAFREVNIDDDPDAEDLVYKIGNGRRKVPMVQIGERLFSCSPFNAATLARELNIPLNR